MKKTIILISILMVLIFASTSYAAIGAATVWEIRQDATANNVNGGGFDSGVAVPGTDYSQQAAAQDYGTDLACADGDVATPTVTSATHNFVAADEGNIIHITAGAGWTAGWYTITDTAANGAILDRACGTDGAKTGGTWYYGGAMSLNSTLDDDFFEQLVAGNIVYVKYSATPYALGETVSVAASGTSDAPIKMLGYNTTRGDGETTTRPTIAKNLITWTIPGAYWVIENFITTGAGSSGLSLSGNYNRAQNVFSTNTSALADKNGISAGGSYCEIINCETVCALGNGISVSTSGVVMGNYVHDSTIGISVIGANSKVMSNIVDTVITAGLSMSSLDGAFIAYNTFYCPSGAKGTTGILGTSSINNIIVGNIFNGWVTPITVDAADIMTVVDYNDYYGNTNVNSTTFEGTHNITTDPGFVDAPNGNFRVGTNMKALGFPGTFPGGLSIGYVDIGAVQRVEPTASGGGTWAQ